MQPSSTHLTILNKRFFPVLDEEGLLDGPATTTTVDPCYYNRFTFKDHYVIVGKQSKYGKVYKKIIDKRWQEYVCCGKKERRTKKQDVVVSILEEMKRRGVKFFTRQEDGDCIELCDRDRIQARVKESLRRKVRKEYTKLDKKNHRGRKTKRVNGITKTTTVKMGSTHDGTVTSHPCSSVAESFDNFSTCSSSSVPSLDESLPSSSKLEWNESGCSILTWTKLQGVFNEIDSCSTFSTFDDPFVTIPSPALVMNHTAHSKGTMRGEATGKDTSSPTGVLDAEMFQCLFMQEDEERAFYDACSVHSSDLDPPDFMDWDEETLAHDTSAGTTKSAVEMSLQLTVDTSYVILLELLKHIEKRIQKAYDEQQDLCDRILILHQKLQNRSMIVHV